MRKVLPSAFWPIGLVGWYRASDIRHTKGCSHTMTSPQHWSDLWKGIAFIMNHNNNVLVSQFRGWSLVCSIDMLYIYIYIYIYVYIYIYIYIYIHLPRCLIIDCFYGPRYVSHPPFFKWSANLWAHWLYASTTASYTLVYLWIFIDYYGECEIADVSMYLEQSNRESTHIYGLLVTPRKRGAGSAELTRI